MSLLTLFSPFCLLGLLLCLLSNACLSSSSSSSSSSPSSHYDVLHSSMFYHVGVVTSIMQWSNLSLYGPVTELEPVDIGRPLVEGRNWWYNGAYQKPFLIINNTDIPRLTSTHSSSANWSLSPPLGIRSAMEACSWGSGYTSMLADGTFQMMATKGENPVNEARVTNVIEMGFFLQAYKHSDMRMIQVHPPAGVLGVNQLSYQSSFPLSRLDVNRDDFGGVLNGSLFTHSKMKPGFNNLNSSSTPALFYSLAINNLLPDESLTVSFAHVITPGQDRDHGRNIGNPQHNLNSSTNSSSSSACAGLCGNTSGCLSWDYNPVYVPVNCLLHNVVDEGAKEYGTTSGVPGSFSYVPSLTGLQWQSQYQGDQPNGQTVLAAWELPEYCTVAAFATDTFSDAVNILTTGTWPDVHKTAVNNSASAVIGTVVVTCVLPPGIQMTIELIYAWYYPVSPWRSQAKPPVTTILSPFYSTQFSSALDIYNTLVKTSSSSQLTTDVLQYHTLFTFSSLPHWLKDYCVTAFSNMFQVKYYGNGDLRQLEASDDVDSDCIHNSFERDQWTWWFHPDAQIKRMMMWLNDLFDRVSDTQGIFYEWISFNDEYYKPGGRLLWDDQMEMIIMFYQHWKQTNDTTLMRTAYPVFINMWNWILSRPITNTSQYAFSAGLPYNWINTYDAFGFDGLGYVGYNVIWSFVGMKAMIEMALFLHDNNTAILMQQQLTQGQQLFEQHAWNESLGYYVAYWNNPHPTDQPMFADTFHGLVLAHHLGFHDLVPNATRLLSHLYYQFSLLDTDYGFLNMSPRPAQCSTPASCPYDQNVWTMSYASYAVLHLWIRRLSPLSPSIVNTSMALHPWMQVVENLRHQQNDWWDPVGGTIDGESWLTSHYGFWMYGAYALSAITGLQVDMRSGIISLDPIDDPWNSSSSITLPGAGGVAVSKQKGTVNVTCTFGTMQWQQFQYAGVMWNKPTLLTEGQSIYLASNGQPTFTIVRISSEGR